MGRIVGKMGIGENDDKLDTDLWEEQIHFNLQKDRILNHIAPALLYRSE